MAVPKRKVSKARRDKRRSSVWKLEAPALVKCDHCGEYKLPHQVCGNCGYYKGKEIVKKETGVDVLSIVKLDVIDGKVVIESTIED